MYKRTIYIGLSECQRAVKEKNRLEAFAFSLLVKLTFVDSCIKETTYFKMSRHLGLGNTRLKRALTNALKYGYIARDGELYRAKPLKEYGGFNTRLEFEEGSISSHAKHGTELKTPYKLSRLIKEIKIAVLKNHIKKQMAFHDTASGVDASSDNKELKRRKAKLRRMCGVSHVSEEVLEKSARLSITRISEVICSKRSSTKKLVKQLRESGQIIRNFESILLDQFDYDTIRNDYDRARAIFHANYLGGWLCASSGRVYVIVANRYSLPEKEIDTIKYCGNQK